MGRLAQDAKNLILGNDGSDKEPDDFKTELQNAIKSGLITKAEGTLLITSRTNVDKLAQLISKLEEKEVIKASKEGNSEPELLENDEKKKKKKEEEEKRRKEKEQQDFLQQQIEEGNKATRARMEAEKNLETSKEIGRK